MGSRTNKRKITWWEPYASSVRTSIAELATTGVLRPRFWVRVMAVSLGVVGAAVALILWTHPGIALPWPQLAAGLVVAPAMVALPVAIQTLSPRYIDVRRNWIQFTRGQSAVRIRGERIDSVSVEGESPALLVVEYRTPRGAERTLRAVVGRKVDRVALGAMLAELSDVRNRRVGSIAAATVRR